MDIDVLAASYLVEKMIDARLMRWLTPVSPAVGAEMSIPVPAGVFWDIQSVQILYTASAVVSNRTPILQVVDPDGNAWLRLGPQAVIAAGGAGEIHWQRTGYAVINNNNVQYSPLWDCLPIPAGFTIATTTAGRDAAGDAITAIRLVVREIAPDRIAEQVRRLENDVAGIFGRFDYETDAR